MDSKMMEKIMSKGKDKAPEMTDMEKQAKMDVIMELLGMAKTDSGSRVSQGLKDLMMPKSAVTVEAEDPEHLKQGLDLASKLTDKLPLDEEKMEKPEEMEKEDPSKENDPAEIEQDKLEALDPEEEKASDRSDLMRMMGAKLKSRKY